MRGDLVSFQHGQGGRIGKSAQLIPVGNAIEALDQIDVTLQDTHEIEIGYVESALFGEPHDRKLGAANRVRIIFR